MKTLQAGYEVIFMAPQSRRHKGKRATDAVVECARALGIRRMTRRLDVEGAGENGHLHSAHFFELDDQPVELMYVLEDDLAERLIDAVDQAGIPVFCLRRRVEYGHLGN
ncbi:DUF190 domain-containing protein [Litchfieldella rifensis]|uniref:DUF190 domain-containing protein n=1 Tax=Litchfieldella rifensis TaxID=762643 RepID=A0ABV7LM96_9GAMM